MKTTLFATALFAVLFNSPPAANGKVLSRWDFEDETPFHELEIEGEPPRVVADPKDTGNKVMYSVLKPGDQRPERSEVIIKNVRLGDERWIGVRILRPNAVQNGFTCYFQLGPLFGPTLKSPAGFYQLIATGKDGKYQWGLRGYMERFGAKGIRIPMGEVEYNHWDNWVFHLKLRADDSGLLEVWKNGKLMARQPGKNALQGDTMAIKWGVYVGCGNKPEGEIEAYFDEISIGDATSSYDEVVPHSGTRG